MEVLLAGQIPRWGGLEEKRCRGWRRPHRCDELGRPQGEAGQSCCPPACTKPSPGVGDSPKPGAFPSSVPSLPRRGLCEAFRMQWGRRDGSGVARPSPRVIPSHNPSQRVLSWAARGKAAADPPGHLLPGQEGLQNPKSPSQRREPPSFLGATWDLHPPLGSGPPGLLSRSSLMALQALGHNHGVHGDPHPHTVPMGTPGTGGTGFQQPGALGDSQPLLVGLGAFWGRSGVPACWLSPANSRPANHCVFN